MNQSNINCFWGKRLERTLRCKESPLHESFRINIVELFFEMARYKNARLGICFQNIRWTDEIKLIKLISNLI